MKYFIRRCVYVVTIFAVLATMHVIAQKNTIIITEKLFSPPYVSISDEKAYLIGKENYLERVAEAERKLEWWNAHGKGMAEFGAIPSSMIPVKVKPEDDGDFVASGKEIHRNLFVFDKVRPHEESADNLINWVFGTSYFIVAAFILSSVFRWFNNEVMPSLRGSGRGIYEIKNIFVNLNASRRLRKAESEFFTIKNLYDNGLITEDVFLKRKNELKLLVGEDKLFR